MIIAQNISTKYISLLKEENMTGRIEIIFLDALSIHQISAGNNAKWRITIFSKLFTKSVEMLTRKVHSRGGIRSDSRLPEILDESLLLPENPKQLRSVLPQLNKKRNWEWNVLSLNIYDQMPCGMRVNWRSQRNVYLCQEIRAKRDLSGRLNKLGMTCVLLH